MPKKRKPGWGWIGVDFDGTLATFDHWRGVDVLGEPIKPMVDRVKRWLAEGRDVRIFTARICGSQQSEKLARWAIEDWCEEHIGQKLPITNVKDAGMIVLYDDRCVQVEANTGKLLGESQYEQVA